MEIFTVNEVIWDWVNLILIRTYYLIFNDALNHFLYWISQYRTERTWLLHLILDGLRDSMDYYICKKFHVFQQLFTLYNSAVADKALQVSFNEFQEASLGNSWWSTLEWTNPILTKILISTSLDKKFITAWKSITKLVIFQSFVAKCCKMRII
jgi:hypothetical protein